MAIAARPPPIAPTSVEQRMVIHGVRKDGAFELYRLALARDHYDRVEHSSLLPDLDFTLIARLAASPDQHESLRELRRVLGA